MSNQKNLPYEQRINTEAYRKARMQAIVRDNFTCQLEGCGETRLHLLTAHHLLPREQGGTHALDNLLTVCEDCHTRIHNVAGMVELVRVRYQTVGRKCIRV